MVSTSGCITSKVAYGLHDGLGPNEGSDVFQEQGQQNQAYQQVICIKSVIFHNQSPCRTRSLLTPRSYSRMAAKPSASDLGLHTGNVLRGSRMTIVAKNTAPDNTLITGLVLTNVLRRCFLNMSNRDFSQCYHLNNTLF
ncbi:hypothetical protein MKW98_013018 [Papaver atlanticum]|uniref:Uncharacterized protein n=1 Tax=Papaver atlanticum TaxID=357466 RepID=A0AAD4SKP6_9MAGN|nr:hypothetical protein MKW98_013018 [Papaver atlanticum]